MESNVKFFFSFRMLITKWNCDRRKVSYRSLNWMAKRLLIRPSSLRNCRRSSKKNWTHRWHKNNVISRMPWSQWSKIIWYGFCSGGAPSIPISCWRATRSTYRTLWVFVFRMAFWTSSSASHTDARLVFMQCYASLYTDIAFQFPFSGVFFFWLCVIFFYIFLNFETFLNS